MNTSNYYMLQLICWNLQEQIIKILNKVEKVKKQYN